MMTVATEKLYRKCSDWKDLSPDNGACHRIHAWCTAFAVSFDAEFRLGTPACRRAEQEALAQNCPLHLQCPKLM